MDRRPAIHREKGVVNFPIYIYPFEATNIAPARGGSNIDEIVVEGHGVEIAQRELPSDWQMPLEEALWWISLDLSWLEPRDIQIPSNTASYELEFFMTALNLCLDKEVFFTRFARSEYQAYYYDGEYIQPSSGLQLIEILERPLPNTLTLDLAVLTQVTDSLFDVLIVDEHTDLTKGIESYRAAIQSFNTEIHVRVLYSVCENILFTGNPNPTEKDSKIADISTLNQKEAEAWRHLVNRTKHPDEGTPYEWEDTFEEVPPPVELRMREAAHEAILEELLPP